jgi:D-glycero-D-manno-heptose 1,7-bisphosphate phosphatase
MVDRNWLVLLDRDGTINEEVNYLSSINQLKLTKNSVKAIKMLNETRIPVCIVSNQAGVARGYFTIQQLNEIHEHFLKILEEQGAFINDISYCPHHPIHGNGIYTIDCECRKPKPGQIFKLLSKYNAVPECTFMVGDKLSDIIAGRNAGVRTILVRTGYGNSEENKINDDNKPDLIVNDLLEAALYISKLYFYCNINVIE